MKVDTAWFFVCVKGEFSGSSSAEGCWSWWGLVSGLVR